MKILRFSLSLCATLLLSNLGNLSFADLAAPPVIVAPALPDYGSDMVPLQALVRKTIDYSPAIREALANFRASEQDLKQSRGALWPRLELNAGSKALTRESDPANIGNTQNNHILGSVTYNVLDFGRVRSQIEAREFQSLSFQDKVQVALEAATFDTVNAYLQLIKYQRLIEIYGQHISDLDVLVGKLSEIVVLVPGRRSELTQAQTRKGLARDALASLRARQHELKLVLLRQTGVAEFGNISNDVPSFPVAPLESLLAIASKDHPAVRSARSEAASARAQANEAEAAQKPQTDLIFTKQGGRDANGMTSPAQLYLTAKWVAFDGSINSSAIQGLRERALAADERAGQLLYEIDFNIRAAFADYQSQSERARELVQLVEGTNQVRKDTFDQWRELGRRSLLDVLTAENEHLNTRISLASSEVDQVIAVARMRHEAGTLKEWLVGDEGRTVPAETSIHPAESAVMASVLAPAPPPVVPAPPQVAPAPPEATREPAPATASPSAPVEEPRGSTAVAVETVPAEQAVEPVAVATVPSGQAVQLVAVTHPLLTTAAAPIDDSVPVSVPLQATHSESMSVPAASY